MLTNDKITAGAYAIMEDCGRVYVHRIYKKTATVIQEHQYCGRTVIRGVSLNLLRPIRKIPGKGGIVERGKLMTHRMVAGQEKHYRCAMVDGCVMRWVGVYWINDGIAEDDDYDRYPLAVDRSHPNAGAS